MPSTVYVLVIPMYYTILHLYNTMLFVTFSPIVIFATVASFKKRGSGPAQGSSVLFSLQA